MYPLLNITLQLHRVIVLRPHVHIIYIEPSSALSLIYFACKPSKLNKFGYNSNISTISQFSKCIFNTHKSGMNLFLWIANTWCYQVFFIVFYILCSHQFRRWNHEEQSLLDAVFNTNVLEIAISLADIKLCSNLYN